MKLIFFFILIFSTNIFSAQNTRKILVPNEKTPVEFSFLIQSLHLSKLSPIEKRRVDQVLIRLDQKFERLTKEEIFFILKTESYKMVLKRKPNLIINRNSYDKKILDFFDPYLKKAPLSPFAKWMILSIKTDLEDILESPLFATWKIRKKYNNPLDEKLIRLEKKLELLLPWYEYLNTTDPKDFDLELKETLLSLLEHLELYTTQLIQYSQIQNLEISPIRPKFSFFMEKEFDIDKKQELQKKTVENIVNSVLDNKLPVALPTPVNDWLPREDGTFPESARAYPTPDPNYKIPENLPKPVDDWFNDL